MNLFKHCFSVRQKCRAQDLEEKLEGVGGVYNVAKLLAEHRALLAGSKLQATKGEEVNTRCRALMAKLDILSEDLTKWHIAATEVRNSPFAKPTWTCHQGLEEALNASKRLRGELEAHIAEAEALEAQRSRAAQAGDAAGAAGHTQKLEDCVPALQYFEKRLEALQTKAQSGRTEYADVSREYIATATEGAALKAQVEAAELKVLQFKTTIEELRVKVQKTTSEVADLKKMKVAVTADAEASFVEVDAAELKMKELCQPAK